MSPGPGCMEPPGSVPTKLNSLNPELPQAPGVSGSRPLGLFGCILQILRLLGPCSREFRTVRSHKQLREPPNLGKTERALERKAVLGHFSSVALSKAGTKAPLLAQCRG